MLLNTKNILTIPSPILWLLLFFSSFLTSLSDIFYTTSILFILLWFYLLNLELEKRIKDESRLPKLIIYYFKATVIFLPIFIFVKTYYQNWNTPKILLPLEVFLTAGMFVAVFVVSRNLVVAERRMVSDFATYLGTAFLLCILPIGLFFVQPRIVKCIKNHEPLDAEPLGTGRVL
jgi:hypothetical protein